MSLDNYVIILNPLYRQTKDAYVKMPPAARGSFKKSLIGTPRRGALDPTKLLQKNKQ